MFKKLILSILAVGSSYAIEPSKELPSGNNIQQNTEEVKNNNNICNDNQLINTQTNNTSNNTNTIILQDDTKAFLYSDDINVPDKKDKNASKNIDEKQFAASIDKLFLKYPESDNSGEKVFDLTSLRPKQFKNMTNDEKDWARLLVYNNFSRLCQAFIQKSFMLKEVSRSLKDSFWDSRETRLCIVTGLDIKQIFFDELNFNTSKCCYRHRPPVLKQLVLFCCQFPRVQQSYRKQLLERGIIDCL